MRRFGLRLLVFLLPPFVLLGACGKKAPPLAPLNMAPEAPQAVAARRLGDTVYLQMTVPAKGTAGPGPFSIDHIDIYAVTLAPGTVYPPNRDLLKPQYVIAKIPVQPPLDPEAPEPDQPDTRAKRGEFVTFVEKLTEAQLVPQVITKPPPPPKPSKTKTGETPAPSGPLPPAGAAAPPAPPPGPLVLTRLYVAQGVPARGRGAAPSARIEVPLLQAPGAPRPGKTESDETSVTVTWDPPASTTDEASGVLYNVYAADAAFTTPKPIPAPPIQPGVPLSRPAGPPPLNEKPLAEPTFRHAGAEPGKEQCFVVRSVATVGAATIESDPSAPICVTPADTFPPAAPKGLAAVAGSGTVNLIWDANTEADLAGYLVLRGDAPGDRLQPLTRDPIRETRYSDRTARPGVRHVYEIVAVDRAGNRSAPSRRVEESPR